MATTPRASAASPTTDVTRNATRDATMQRGRSAVATALVLIGAPVISHGAGKLFATWAHVSYVAAPITVATIAVALLCGALTIARGRTDAIAAPSLAVLAALLLVLVARTPPVAAIAAMTATGAAVFAGLRWLSARAPLPRGRFASVAFAVLCLITIAQCARVSTFLADASFRRGALIPSSEFFVRHSCLSGYVNAVVLAKRGDANIYDSGYAFHVCDTHGVLPAAIDTSPLSMDPYEYPPQFLPLPAMFHALTSDFFAI